MLIAVFFSPPVYWYLLIFLGWLQILWNLGNQLDILNTFSYGLNMSLAKYIPYWKVSFFLFFFLFFQIATKKELKVFIENAVNCDL